MARRRIPPGIRSTTITPGRRCIRKGRGGRRGNFDGPLPAAHVDVWAGAVSAEPWGRRGRPERRRARRSGGRSRRREADRRPRHRSLPCWPIAACDAMPRRPGRVELDRSSVVDLTAVGDGQEHGWRARGHDAGASMDRAVLPGRRAVAGYRVLDARRLRTTRPVQPGGLPGAGPRAWRRA